MINTYSSSIKRKELDSVLNCMVTEKVGPGELNRKFIQDVKKVFECDGAVALRSPTQALALILKALDFKEGSIMISALSPSWYVSAIETLGHKVLVLDVDDATGLVNQDIVRKGIEDGGRLLILYEGNGILPNMDSLLALNIPLIEDISQSVGCLVPCMDEDDTPKAPRRAGSFGYYTIMTLEEKDLITAGGGAVLMASHRREWSVLKKYTDLLSDTDLLPDLNAALALSLLKNYYKEEDERKKIFCLYRQACTQGKHKMFIRQNNPGSLPPVEGVEINTELDYTSIMGRFPLVLNSNYKDVHQYASKKEIEIRPCYEDSVLDRYMESYGDKCIKAKSLYLRTCVFPLYSRLSKAQVTKIVKILGTLP